MLIASIVIILLLLLKDGKPSESWLMENIPAEILNYKLDSEEYTSTVESIKIERRNTDNDVDDAYCMRRTAYIEIVSRKYDKGGWQLESWDEYQTESGTALRGFDEEFVYTYLCDTAGYTGISDIKDNSAVENGELSYSCAVNENYDYISVKGRVTLNAKLSFEVEGVYPHNYFWEIDVDSSGVSSEWKLDGDFELVDNQSITGSYFEISTRKKKNKLKWDTKYGLYEYRFPSGYKVYNYKSDGEADISNYQGPAKFASLEIKLMSGYCLVYTKDSVIMGNSTTAFARENTLEKR